jgi:hypothetical protein
MSEFVFILGAGASAHTGAPVMKDFFSTLYDLHAYNQINKEDREAFELIIQARQDLERISVKVDLPIDNMETLFSLIEMGRLIGSFPGMTPVETLHKAIQRVIVRTIELKTICHHVPGDYDAYDLLLKEIKALWGQRGVPRSSIITFNYDLAIDRAVERNMGAIDYCLKEPQDSAHHGFKLLKLHGSFNWAKASKGDKVEVVPISVTNYVNEYSPAPPIRNIITAADLPIKKEKADFCIEIGSRINKLKQGLYAGYNSNEFDEFPLIVPPTWSKTEYHPILKSVWAQAAREIAGARYIFVIGYSMPSSDLFFQHLLALSALNIASLKVLWIIDRDQGVIDKYKELIRMASDETFRSSPQDFTKFAVEHIHNYLKYLQVTTS